MKNFFAIVGFILIFPLLFVAVTLVVFCCPGPERDFDAIPD